MSTNFGIKQSFRTQSIARKFARSNVPKKDDTTDSDNVFENDGKNFFVKNVASNFSSASSSSVSSSSVPLNSTQHKTLNSMNASLRHMKNYNRIVTKSADHM